MLSLSFDLLDYLVKFMWLIIYIPSGRFHSAQESNHALEPKLSPIVMCMAWPEAMSQAKLDQNDGFMRALAWPSILQSQSQAVRLQLLQAMDRIIKL